MIYLALGLLVLLSLLFLARWFRDADPGVVASKLRLGGLVSGLVLLVFLLVTGRIALVWAAFLAMLPWISRLRMVMGILSFLRRGAPGQARPNTPDRTQGTMTRAQAAKILNVAPDATPEQIRTAHREQMKRNHPDHGGSHHIAQMLNQARDVLLAQNP